MIYKNFKYLDKRDKNGQLLKYSWKKLSSEISFFILKKIKKTNNYT